MYIPAFLAQLCRTGSYVRSIDAAFSEKKGQPLCVPALLAWVLHLYDTPNHTWVHTDSTAFKTSAACDMHARHETVFAQRAACRLERHFGNLSWCLSRRTEPQACDEVSQRDRRSETPANGCSERKRVTFFLTRYCAQSIHEAGRSNPAKHHLGMLQRKCVFLTSLNKVVFVYNFLWHTIHVACEQLLYLKRLLLSGDLKAKPKTRTSLHSAIKTA